MSAFLVGLLAEFWKPLAAGVAALLAGFGLYLKGKSDQKQKAKLDDVTTANQIRKVGADARAGAAVQPDSLRNTDGFKRD